MTERYLHINHIADLIAAEITGRIDDVGERNWSDGKVNRRRICGYMSFTGQKIFLHLNLNLFVNIVRKRLLMNSRRK